jgi:hypothetical protein
MDKISNNSACVIGVIALIAVIPRYIQLPNSLELLFHDMIGQLLLLLLAITVGSYNFTCGVLLVILFLSIMLQSKIKSKYASEGFIDYEGSEDKDMELNENFATKKTKKSSDMEDVEDVETKDMEENVKPSDMEDPEEEYVEEEEKPTSKPKSKSKKITMPSPTPYNSVVNDLKKELQASQKKIKTLESQMKNALGSSNNNMELAMESKNKSEMEMAMEMESKNKSEMEMAREMAMEMEMQATPPPIFEGFDCDYTNDNRRTKYIKFQEAQGLIETFQNQPTQEPRVKVESDCYDLAGCKYQNGYTPFNDTFHGPPVDSCHAYRKANINATGTLFYPLN